MLAATDPLPPRALRRVLVAGVSGVGKTALAGRIATRLQVPHTEIDALFHGPQWTPRPEFVADVEAFTSEDAWVTEWQYSAVRPLLADRAQLLVWLDLPYRVAFARVVARTIRRSRRGEVLWNGNVEPGLWHAITSREGIIRWSIATRNLYRDEVPRVEASHPDLVVVQLRSRRDVETWLAALQATVG